MEMFAAINELQRHCSYAFSRMGNLLIDSTESRNPLVSKPVATEQTYRELAKTAAAQIYPEIDEFELVNAFAISPTWLHDLALHTQIVVKKSPLCYAHGRILYSALDPPPLNWSTRYDSSGRTDNEYQTT
jgi:hypothetical protein